MKNRIAQLLLILCLVCASVSTGSAHILVIDPGHGGSDPGCPSAISGFWEKSANLSVCLALADSLTSANYVNGYDYFLTRDTDMTLSPARRAAIAMECSATEFICVHHNADSLGVANYSRTFWCNACSTWTSPQLMRDSSALLASKVGHRIEQSFHLSYAMETQCPLIVLHGTTMISTLTEASFISNQAEALLFTEGTRAQQEAGAIFHGWHSYVTRGGFGIVRNAYSSGTGGTVRVDGTLRSSPSVEVWERGEFHDLEFTPQQVFPDSCLRTFFRWAHTPLWQTPRDTMF
jgi:N-acetylmuramoyl-L-alanine amidase